MGSEDRISVGSVKRRKKNNNKSNNGEMEGQHGGGHSNGGLLSLSSQVGGGGGGGGMGSNHRKNSNNGPPIGSILQSQLCSPSPPETGMRLSPGSRGKVNLQALNPLLAGNFSYKLQWEIA
jgi:hypothetical protein